MPKYPVLISGVSSAFGIFLDQLSCLIWANILKQWQQGFKRERTGTEGRQQGQERKKIKNKNKKQLKKLVGKNLTGNKKKYIVILVKKKKTR